YLFKNNPLNLYPEFPPRIKQPLIPPGVTPPKTKAFISLIIGVIMLLLLATLFFSLFTINRIKSNLTIQVHTSTVILALKDNLTYLLNAETGERGFIITSDTNFLEPYHS